MVVAAPGTQILISLLPTLWPRSRVAVLGPTYAEHAHAWRGAGHEVAEVSSLDEIGGADILVLVNPNNPDGRTLEREALLEEAGRLRQRGGWLVVDEAFADFDAGETLVPVLPDNAIVLRSFGKTYGLAGIRLGFAIALREHGDAAADDAGSLGRLGTCHRNRAAGPAGPRVAAGGRSGARAADAAAPRRAAGAGLRIGPFAARASIASWRAARLRTCSSIWGIAASGYAASSTIQGFCGSDCRETRRRGSAWPMLSARSSSRRQV